MSHKIQVINRLQTSCFQKHKEAFTGTVTQEKSFGASGGGFGSAFSVMGANFLRVIDMGVYD